MLLHPVDSEAPAGFTWCCICEGYQHPNWHVLGWREGQADASLNRTYSKPPKRES